MNRLRLSAVALLVGATALAGCGHVRHEDERAWTWQGELAPGARLAVRNTNGAVRVERAAGPQVEVVASRSWRGRRPERVEFAVARSGADATVCALWGRGGECDPDHYRSSNRRALWRRLFLPRSQVRVDFVVRVPAGVRIDASSVNGAIAIEGATADVVAETVNGAIEAHSTGGALRLETVNGAITARLDSLPASGDILLETVNGSVTAELPEGLDAQLDMSTVNGRLTTDFPLTLQGKVSPREMRATIGSGGRALKIETVNGNATLKRRGTVAATTSD